MMLFKKFISLFAVALWLLFSKTAPLSAQQFPEGFQYEIVQEGLNPTAMAFAPDGRLMIVEKDGLIKVIEDDTLLEAPFLDIPVEDFNENGLMNMVFHPEYEQNNWFYVYYKPPGSNVNQISRFTANGPSAIIESEEVLIELGLSGSIHNGGKMVFLEDNTLLVGVGDGGDGATAQNMDYLLGKVLRMHDDGSIPTDNPFYESLEGYSRYIYASGIRNTFSGDILDGTDVVFMNDVGQGDWEEVNSIISGANYGWNIIEGPIETQVPPASYTDPIFAYNHSTGCAITAGAFYDGPQKTFPPEYHDVYFYADYCSGHIHMIDPLSGFFLGEFASNLDRPVGILNSPTGELYILERAGDGGGDTSDNTDSENGRLWKVSYTGSGSPFIAQQPHAALHVVGEQATFSVTASGAQPLTYQWSRDGIDISGQNSDVLIVDDVQLSDNTALFACRISNGEGEVLSAEAELTVLDESRPQPQIEWPPIGHTYGAGTTLQFIGSSWDDEDGPLDAESMNWSVKFHHDTHTHPVLSDFEGMQGNFSISSIGETSTSVWYRIHLTATDAAGLSASVFRDVHPEIGSISLNTQPVPLPLLIDGQLIEAPVELESVIGVERQAIAPLTHRQEGQIFAFQSWSNGSLESVANLVAGSDAISISAEYETYQLGDGIGLKGVYHEGADEALFGELGVIERIDSLIDFDWGILPPDSTLPDDEFLVEWDGYLLPIFDGWYSFYVLADDGFRLYINDELIMDHWTGSAQIQRVAEKYLEANTQLPIRIEYREGSFNAAIRLAWSHDRLPYEVVPKTQLNPTPFDAIGFHSDQFWLYPNPSSEVLNVESPFPIKEVRLVDILGRQVNLLPIHESAYRLSFDIRSVHAGVYSLIAEGTNQSETRKLIISR